jgi:SAM-dependent methyltransferase
MDKKYLNIVDHYEKCLEKFGDTHQGVDWPNVDDQIKRFKIMLSVIKDQSQNLSLLDFGCGTAALLDYLQKINNKTINYSGLEISSKFAQVAKRKYPQVDILTVDILTNSASVPEFDYIVMNGVFTEKRDLSYDEMFSYFSKLIHIVFTKAKVGIAFNVMSKNVDWERDDLFHVSKDDLEKFLTKNISRNIIFRADYKLFEYTVYIYKEPYE